MKNIRIAKPLLFGLLVGLLLACQPEAQSSNPFDSQTRYNILWLVAEDLSPYIPPFGDSTVQTPNLSRLAAEGVRYTQVYSVSGVCSPSRAALATGMYPTSIGAHHMRTLFQQPAARAKGLINYEVVPPPQVIMVSEILRTHGYYCTNNPKEDYQFHASKMAWDESGLFAHWRNGPEAKPFFSIFNFGVTHEGQLWAPGSLWNLRYDRDTFPPDRNVALVWENFQKTGPRPLSVSEDLPVQVPPYLPDTEAVRQDMRRMYDNITLMDRFVGRILKQLEEDGLLEQTIIVWYSDHGGPLPRQKRLLYDSGLKVPMIIRYPDQWRAGTTDDQLISFVDFAPSLLSMAHIPAPDYMQGRAFAGAYADAQTRTYIHAAADRFDETYDRIRAVRDRRFKYLKNFQPETPYYLPLAYREQMASMQELLRLRDAGKLNEIQMQWFRATKPAEELFDTEVDPHELHNLAQDPDYASKLQELRAECARWIAATADKGAIPEDSLIRQFWPGKVQPQTATPEARIASGKLHLSCATEGASIGYKFPEDERPGMGWRVYAGPVEVPAGQRAMVIAHRIGYGVSDTVGVGME